MLPAISLLTKISNHLELIRPDAKLEQQDERQVGLGLVGWLVGWFRGDCGRRSVRWLGLSWVTDSRCHAYQQSVVCGRKLRRTPSLRVCQHGLGESQGCKNASPVLLVPWDGTSV